MDPRLAGFTQRLQSIPGAPVPPDEIAQRVQYLYDRLRGQTTAPLSGPQAGGFLPKDLAKHAKRELFSKTGAFPKKGGASFLETLAQNAAQSPQAQQMAQQMAGQAMQFAQSPQAQQMLGQAQGLAGQAMNFAQSPQAQQMLGQAQGLAQAASGGPAALLSALPRAKGPTLESFLESQGIPQIPIKARKVPGDFLGNAARWWVKTASSPYLGTLVKLTFFFMFFISFLESTPLIGSVVSVVLDVILAGGRILVKALQKGLPALLGLIPLPYTQLTGVVLVSVVGMFVWTILATISFGRQDFTSAIESMLRIIPIPIGDAMADAFLDVNRTIDQFNDKRVKLTEEVWNGMLLLQQFLSGIGQFVSSAASGAFQRIQSGADKLLNAIQGVRGAPAAAAAAVPMATPVPEPVPVAAPVPEPVPAAPAPIAPVPEPVPVAAPMATPVPVAAPMATPVPVAAPLPEPVPMAPPTAPPPEPVPMAPPTAPPEPVPVAPPPTFEAGPPPAAPIQPPTFQAGPPPAQSALERLRSGQSVNRDLNVGRGFRGGKPLSGRRHTKRKWTRQEHPLYERFYGLGSR